MYNTIQYNDVIERKENGHPEYLLTDSIHTSLLQKRFYSRSNQSIIPYNTLANARYITTLLVSALPTKKLVNISQEIRYSWAWQGYEGGEWRKWAVSSFSQGSNCTPEAMSHHNATEKSMKITWRNDAIVQRCASTLVTRSNSSSCLLDTHCRTALKPLPPGGGG